jgi:hypothetical protein
MYVDDAERRVRLISVPAERKCTRTRDVPRASARGATERIRRAQRRAGRWDGEPSTTARPCQALGFAIMHGDGDNDEDKKKRRVLSASA